MPQVTRQVEPVSRGVWKRYDELELLTHRKRAPHRDHSCYCRQFSSVARLTLCDPMNHSTPGLPVHHQLPESTQTHVHRIDDAIQPSHPLSSPSPPALIFPSISYCHRCEEWCCQTSQFLNAGTVLHLKNKQVNNNKHWPCEPPVWGCMFIGYFYRKGDFPGGSDGKMSAYNVGDPGSVPGSGRSGEGNGNPLQYYCLENPVDGGAW